VKEKARWAVRIRKGDNPAGQLGLREKCSPWRVEGRRAAYQEKTSL
jgi:hypothetical protein